jgi:uncharacterized protein (DUF169 family)
MTDYSILELQLGEALRLSRRPVAVAFRDIPPIGVPKFAGKEPSGCSFWRLASGSMTFYTVPTEQENCVLGSHIQNIPLGPERSVEYEKTLSMMTSNGYIKMEDILSIPRMKQTPKVIVYAPLGDTPVDPDLVVFVVRAMQAMILQQAGLHAGLGLQISPLGRPTCMSLPAVLDQKDVLASSGCIGSRVYADLADDELYLIVPGRVLRKISDEVQVIAETNEKLTEYHREQRKRFEAQPPLARS